MFIHVKFDETNLQENFNSFRPYNCLQICLQKPLIVYVRKIRTPTTERAAI